MATLVIDTGQDIVGIYSVEEETYTPYRGSDILSAIERIKAADEIVTYNGKHRDLPDLVKFAGITGDFPLKGLHTDMRSVCWSDRIWGSNLFDTYKMHFGNLPEFRHTYEGHNEKDTFLTFKLWELWRKGELKVLDGQYR